MPAPYDLTREELAESCEGEPAYRVRQVWDGLHLRAQRPEDMTELPAALRNTLAEALPPALREVSRQSADDGETTKWLWALHDGAKVETVLMRYPDRVTVCVSTQAGCAMACQFCATGQAGFQRQLTQGEIVEQVAVAMREAAAAAGLQHRLHGDGGAAGQLRPGLGCRRRGCTATWVSRPAISRSRRWASCRASGAWPPRPCP